MKVVINVTNENILVEQLEIIATSIIIKKIDPLSPKSYYTIQIGLDQTISYSRGIEVSVVRYS